jgi:hypothetical protein
MPRSLTAAYLLPTGTTMNLTRPDRATYYDPGATAIVVRRLDRPGVQPYRVLTTFGVAPHEWAVGTKHDIRHDQTGSYLGHFEVTGTRAPGGTTTGEIPARALPHWVFK